MKGFRFPALRNPNPNPPRLPGILPGSETLPCVFLPHLLLSPSLGISKSFLCVFSTLVTFSMPISHADSKLTHTRLVCLLVKTTGRKLVQYHPTMMGSICMSQIKLLFHWTPHLNYFGTNPNLSETNPFPFVMTNTIYLMGKAEPKCRKHRADLGNNAS